MQIWIYFQPGVGGDGFANLLEKAKSKNSHAVDVNDQYCDIQRLDTFEHPWRIHRRVDNQIKFFYPSIDKNECFRYPLSRFNLQDNELIQSYLDSVAQNKTIICTSHDFHLTHADNNDCQEILSKNRKKVLLYKIDSRTAWKNASIKNLYTGPVEKIYSPKTTYTMSKFDHVVDIDLVNTNWEYLENFCKKLDLKLEQSCYQDYLELLAGSRKFDFPGIEAYQSKIKNGFIFYTRVE